MQGLGILAVFLLALGFIVNYASHAIKAKKGIKNSVEHIFPIID